MSETLVSTEAQIENDDDLAAFSDDFFGQKSVEDKAPKTKEVAEQEASDDTEAQTDAEDEAELEEEVKEAPKKKQTVQERINDVVRQREDQKRESDAAMATLRAEIEALKKGTTPEVQEPSKANEPQPDATDKDGNPIYALGEFDPQYIRDLTRFTLNEERAKVQAEDAELKRADAARQEQQALQTGWNEKLAVSMTEYPDLVEKSRDMLTNFESTLNPAYAGYLSTVLMSMDKGPDVLYYLANHPDEATAIVNSGAQKATLALGRIESRFLDADADKALAKPKVSKAPPPPAERARGTNGAFISVAGDTEDLDDFSQAFFEKKK